MRLDKAGLLQNSGRKVTNMQTECKTIPGKEAIYVLMVREALVSQDIWDQSKLRGVQDRWGRITISWATPMKLDHQG